MRSWPISTVETEMRRLKILQYLASVPTYEANAQMLSLFCRQVGVPTTIDQTVAGISWLKDMELITFRSIDDEPIVKLTRLGRDVATGNRVMPGVLRPDP